MGFAQRHNKSELNIQAKFLFVYYQQDLDTRCFRQSGVQFTWEKTIQTTYSLQNMGIRI